MGVLSKATAKLYNVGLTTQSHHNSSSSSPASSPLHSAQEWSRMSKELGTGPMRFAPTHPNALERSTEEQIAALDPTERECLDGLKQRWAEKYDNSNNSSDKKRLRRATDALFLRYARNTPEGPFQEKAAWKLLMKTENMRYLSLTVTDLESQILRKTLFPLPGVTSLEKYGSCPVFYMFPSRYFPKSTPTQVILDNLAYCMDTMLEYEHASTHGLVFIARMNGWTMSNFNFDYCYQFMQMLQGKIIPVQVQLFLIVNPPSWFNNVWHMMRPMLSEEFEQRVQLIPESRLEDYLAPGFQQALPNDTGYGVGQANVDQLVQDWIAYRQYLERNQQEDLSSSSSHHSSSLSTAERIYQTGRKGKKTSITTVSSEHSATEPKKKKWFFFSQ